MSGPPSETQTPTLLKALCDVSAGTRSVVRQLRGGKEFTGRVAALGFTIGAEITVIENYGRGPIIAMVRNTRVALGRGESAKIRVEVLP
jgi:ferrous iron transport protein A